MLNGREKRQTWKRQNRKRDNFTKFFQNDVKEDYKDLTKELVKVAEQTKGAEQRVIDFALTKAISDWSPQLKKTMQKNINMVMRDFGGEIFGEAKSLPGYMETKANLKFDQYVKKYLEQRTQNISTITNNNAKQVRRIVSEWTAQAAADGMSNEELSKFLQMEFEELSEGNARRIARTEVTAASQNGSLEAVKSLGIPNMTKEWVTAVDDRTRDGSKGGPDHAAMNGQVVGLDEKFTVPPDCDMDGPGAEGAPAEQVINCRCCLVFKSNN